MTYRISLLFFAFVGLAATGAAQERTASTAKIAWKRTVVDKLFRAEGVAVADVNKDGKKDIVVGDVWYEAPDWKMHILAKERQVQFKDWGDVMEKGWSPVGRPGMTGYSESFGVLADDFNRDGWVDVVVMPFPGKECFWYENPGAKGGLWKQHLVTNSACNETPIYVDLFGKGQKLLVMGWQPPGQGNMGEMCYFIPGKDATKPWERISISGPSEPKKEVPGTQRFSHGLGHGDVNGDGRIDIIIPQGWWEQPAQVDGTPWKFHPANLGPACADMFAFDLDGDGKNDIISSSAHQYGFWWYQQKSPMEFVQRELFPDPFKVAKLPKDHGLSDAELALYNAVNKHRAEQGRAPWKLSAKLTAEARELVAKAIKGGEVFGAKGTILGDSGEVAQVRILRSTRHHWAEEANAAKAASELLPVNKTALKYLSPELEIGVSVTKTQDGQPLSTILIHGIKGRQPFSLPSQTHALHFVDINGDGQKDLVTGRRWWAHGPKGDAGPNDPAYIYWFEARKNKDGGTEFIPHEVDDDSGIGTAFAVEDINGDGIPDIIVSNKRGVYVLTQVRTPVAAVPPPKND